METLTDLLAKLAKLIPFEKMTSLEQFREHFYFLSGEPYPKGFILWFIGLCLLISVAGGGKIVYGDREIGQVKTGGRILSFVLAIFGIIFYFIVPSPYLKIDGIFSDSHFANSVKASYEVLLTPASLAQKSKIGEHGFFDFTDSAKIKKGEYFLSLIENGTRVVHHQKINLELDKREILLLKEDDRYSIIDEKICRYFQKQYTRERNWMAKYRALRLLELLCSNDDKLVARFRELSTSGDVDKERLSAFVLGSLKDKGTINKLIDIMNDDRNLHTPFDKLRAAFYLNYYPGNFPGGNRSFPEVCQEYLLRKLTTEKEMIGLRDVTEGVRCAAADYLSRLGRTCFQVLEQIIKGIGNDDPELSAYFQLRMEEITDNRQIPTAEEWTIYLDHRRAKYPSCAL